MKLLVKIIITALLVLIIAHFMSGVHVINFVTALIVALVLALLNVFIKPVLVLFTLPVTILTLGLFLLIINAVIILLCSAIVGGFTIDSFWTALLFSVILSVFQSFVFAITGNK